MKLSALFSLATVISVVASSPFMETSSDTVPVFALSESRIANLAPDSLHDRYRWDFETFSQPNYYGDRQRFNGDGCVNFRCINIQSYQGLPNKEYIFYDGDDCYGAVILRTTKEKLSPIPQPFAPCSIRVQEPSNWQGAGKPPAGTDLAIFPQPRYKGRSSTFVGVNTCHELKGEGVMSYQGHEIRTYTFYLESGCKGKVVEKNKGPNSRTNAYIIPKSVKID
ncbi:hypothetical protein BGZ94_006502 [Podila epigama]|nr:hypothetical protein BGZ94_006502 [Podila epigama]